MSRFLVLGVKAYNFNNDRNEAVRGMKVIYLDSEPEDEHLVKGYIPLFAPADFKVLDEFDARPFPAVFDLKFRMRPAPVSMKPVLTVVKASFIEEFPLQDIIGEE